MRIVLLALLCLGIAALPAAAMSDAALEQRLATLGYLPPASNDGVVDAQTTQSVMAFQGWTGLVRDGVAGPKTTAALARARRPRGAATGARHLEVSLARQVLLLVAPSGRVVRAMHLSSGAPGTPTPTGDYRIERRITRDWSVPFAVWLPWAQYVVGGYAFHAHVSVPGYPASHGCMRLYEPEARTLWSFTSIGTPVRIR